MTGIPDSKTAAMTPGTASDEVREALEAAEQALNGCYEVQSYPGDGTSGQDHALALVRSALAALPLPEATERLPTYGNLLADINKAAHAAGTNAWVRDVLKQAHRAIRLNAPLATPEATGEREISQHIGWLKQYIQGMDETNWKDMRLRAERQLEQLSSMVSSTRLGSAAE